MQRHFPIVTGLLFTALAGCQSYAPYGYSSMGGGYYGNGYSAPPPAGTTFIQPQPGSVYTPRMMQPAPPPGTSYSAGPRALPPGGMMQPAPRPSGQPLGSTTATPPGSPRVPNYNDGPAADSGLGPTATPPAGGLPSAPLGTPANPDDGDDDFKKPLGLNSTGERTSNMTNDADENLRKLGSETFIEPNSPIGKKDANAKKISFESSDQSEGRRPNPYAFDPKAYTWLRGVLDYDAVDKRWHITYSNDPQDRDTYGGSLTLVNNPQLEERFLNNDVVLVEGNIDVNQRDRFGKPVYKIHKINRIKPKSNVTDPSKDR